MSKTLAIKGHPTCGKEVIELLEMLGGENHLNVSGHEQFNLYYINNKGVINYKHHSLNKDMIVFTLEEFLEKYPFKIGDKVNSPCKGCIKTITSMKWDEYLNAISYKLDNKIYTNIDQLKVNNDLPSKEEINMKDKKLFGTVSNPVETKSYTVSLKDDKVIDNSIDASQFMQIGKILTVCFNPENYEDEVELQLGDYKIEVCDGKTYAVLNKPKYPKTYEECCKNYPDNEKLKIGNLLCDLEQLIICRNAYWKIAGEQMGLGKPWKPDWSTENEIKYVIEVYRNNVRKNSQGYSNTLLAFPTKEMRDVFYENFKDLIEKCKELL